MIMICNSTSWLLMQRALLRNVRQYYTAVNKHLCALSCMESKEQPTILKSPSKGLFFTPSSRQYSSQRKLGEIQLRSKRNTKSESSFLESRFENSYKKNYNRKTEMKQKLSQNKHSQRNSRHGHNDLTLGEGLLLDIDENKKSKEQIVNQSSNGHGLLLDVNVHKKPKRSKDLFAHESTNGQLTGLGKREFRKRHVKSLPPTKGEVLFGLFPVLLALQEQRRSVYKLFIKENLFGADHGVAMEIQKLANEGGVEVKKCPLDVLDGLSSFRPHQGVCMDVSKLKPVKYAEESKDLDVPEQVEANPRIWLVLQNIQDPMNFGAILRSSYYFGVDRVLTVADSSCSMSPVVSKASAGALEITDIQAIDDLPDFIKEKKEGGWDVAGTASVVANNVPMVPLHQVAIKQDTIILLGNEGSGLSSDVQELCNYVVSIQPFKQFHPGLDSLNVSVATGVLLYQLAMSRNN
ncbi:unnamed protein product [Owenia fusiformis]|uniref:rRNA methyltransferase 1, mitochondrial n=1 Tax=Owenia fusiformis TaxID=6347 RepID=A0A8J1Y9W9_OWEFU|nr:unnamed protein product [Owenia fusiformis]